MPAKGLNTRTVAFSSQSSRPARNIEVVSWEAAGSIIRAASWGEWAGSVTVSPLTFGSGVSAGFLPEWQPSSGRDSISVATPIANFRSERGFGQHAAVLNSNII